MITILIALWCTPPKPGEEYDNIYISKKGETTENYDDKGVGRHNKCPKLRLAQ
jgi:hypothetical protein